MKVNRMNVRGNVYINILDFKDETEQKEIFEIIKTALKGYDIVTQEKNEL